jgi:hypothetical protein
LLLLRFKLRCGYLFAWVGENPDWPGFESGAGVSFYQSIQVTARKSSTFKPHFGLDMKQLHIPLNNLLETTTTSTQFTDRAPDEASHF